MQPAFCRSLHSTPPGIPDKPFPHHGYRRGSFVLEAKQFAGPAAEPTDLQLALGMGEKKKAGPVRGSQSWHEAIWKARGQSLPAEPVLQKFRNIECRDAVLAWDGDPVPARDERGEIVTVWDRRSQKTDLVTGRDVPDETKRVPLLGWRSLLLPRSALETSRFCAAVKERA
jgi:hypothetical protein